MSEPIDTQLLLRALEFYFKSPDGQYDQVAVDLIEQELARRPMTASEVLYRNRVYHGPKVG